MLTVIVDFEGSGNTRTCNPLASLYWVMPSTDVTFSTPLGSVCPELTPGERRTRNRAANPMIRFISKLLAVQISGAYPRRQRVPISWRLQRMKQLVPFVTHDLRGISMPLKQRMEI